MDETEVKEEIEDQEETPKEAWMVSDEEQVPASTHMHIKQKLKGRVSERDDEISKLKQEIEALKTKPTVNPGTRPSLGRS